MRRHSLVIALLLLVTFGVFSRVLQAEFVAWDDQWTVPTNTWIQGLDAHRLGWMFTNVSFAMRYKPLCWLSYALIHAAAGLKPSAYHLANLVFHCLNAALVYVLIRELLLRTQAPPSEAEREPSRLAWCAGLGALAWAVHPLRVEAVARVTDLTYCQSLFFLLISLWCYLRANAGAGPATRGFYWGSVGAFALSMLSYPFAFGYALVLVVLDVYPLRRFNSGPRWWRDAAAGRIWLAKIPFALLGGLVLLTLLGRLNPVGGWELVRPPPPLTVPGRAMQAAYIWAYYLWKPWTPLHLAPVYTTLVSFNPAAWPFLASAALVIGLTALLVWQRNRWPWALALWVCHLVLLASALGLTEHPHYPGDRYSYVPGILWSVLLAGSLLKLSRRPGWFTRAAGASLVLLAVLGAMSVQQTRIWRDSISLFEYTLAVLGDNPYRADIHWRLGRAYAQQQKPDEAIKQYQRVAQMRPSPLAEYTLAYLLSQQGQLEQAETHFRSALKLNPEYAAAWCELGVVHARQGRPEMAAEDYAAALRVKPAYAQAHLLLGALLGSQKKVDEAIAQFNAVLRADPANADAHYNIGQVLNGRGDYAGAAAHYAEAARLRPDDMEMRQSLGLALLFQGKLSEAAQQFEALLRAQPSAAAHYYLALALDGQGQPEGAVAHYREAIRLAPKTSLYLNDLAWLLATSPKGEARNGVEAVQLAEEACRLSDGKVARFWGTLDAAYAEAGRFTDAVATATRTRELALAAGQPDLATAAEKRLELYRAGKPYRSGVPPTQ